MRMFACCFALAVFAWVRGVPLTEPPGAGLPLATVLVLLLGLVIATIQDFKELNRS